MAETKGTPASAKQPQTVKKKPQVKQPTSTLQKPLSQGKTGQIAAKTENTGRIAAKEEKTGQVAAKAENTGHIEAAEEKAPEENKPEVVGHFGAKEEKEVTEKDRIDYTPLDWGKDDNISDFLVTMLSGNLSDWFVNNMKFVGQYVDIAVERANDLSKKIEEDKKLMQTKEDKSKSIVQKAAVFFILKPPFVIL